MKKFFIGLISVITLIVLLIGGKTYMANREMQNIVHGEEGKVAIENMLRVLDEKALTPEGKIKSYKIDESYTKRNPMGGIDIAITLNDDKDMVISTTLSKEGKTDKYKTEAMLLSPEADKIIER